ncbi:MAG: hypothetical protein JRJ58_21090, partial [Deltaproteobacteria bacterium]|nr:hypothetical protein [Deltaproteobacteria bacterium]
RRDLERTVTVSARHAFWKARDFAEAVRSDLDAIELPAGYHLAQGGELESSG